jgi:hypothetical protein
MSALTQLLKPKPELSQVIVINGQYQKSLEGENLNYLLTTWAPATAAFESEVGDEKAGTPG